MTSPVEMTLSFFNILTGRLRQCRSERYRRFKAQRLSCRRMSEAQGHRMQGEARRGGAGLVMRIEFVAENRMADLGKVNPQLVRPAGQPRQRQPGGVGLHLKCLVTGRARSEERRVGKERR